MARQAGLDYFPMAVDMLNDDKIYEIMAEAGGGDRKSTAAWAAKGWVDEILAQIYGHGFALEMTRGAMEDLAHDLGMAPAELEEFIAMCVRHGLFDAGLWASSRVLTSQGIQKRYAIACKRGVKSLVGPWVLSDGGIIPENRRNEPKSAEIDRNAPKSAAKEKEKEKEKEKKKEAANLTSEMGAPACLSAPGEGGGVFIDLNGAAHRTAAGAIAASLAAKGHGSAQGINAFMGQLRGLCPQGCRGDPERAAECYRLSMRGIETFDPAKGRDPWPITRKIITEDRSAS